jgi:hypothetical protein
VSKEARRLSLAGYEKFANHRLLGSLRGNLDSQLVILDVDAFS